MTYNFRSYNYQLPKGTIALLESGEYSDRDNIGLFVALRDVCLEEEARAFEKHVRENPQQYDLIGLNHHSFVSYLCANQTLATLECREVHIGSYGTLSIGDHRINFYDLAEEASDD